jgi:hypothetical protein
MGTDSYSNELRRIAKAVDMYLHPDYGTQLRAIADGLDAPGELSAAVELLRECVEGTVEDCTKWNRRTRAFLRKHDATGERT